MLHLPLEIVRIIVECARYESRLFPLLFVSKEFLHETCRVLYRHIYIKSSHKRHHLPLNSAVKRSYYASLVKTIIIDSCRLHNDIRRILYATHNLKTLEIFDWDFSNIQFILRTDYPFQLGCFTYVLGRHERLTEFLESQPSIKTLYWFPRPFVADARTSLVETSSLPGLENYCTSVPLMESRLFLDGKLKRLFTDECIQLPKEPTAASRHITSVALRDTSMVTLDDVLAFFPNVRYLDGDWSVVSAFPNYSYNR